MGNFYQILIVNKFFQYYLLDINKDIKIVEPIMNKFGKYSTLPLILILCFSLVNHLVK